MISACAPKEIASPSTPTLASTGAMLMPTRASKLNNVVKRITTLAVLEATVNRVLVRAGLARGVLERSMRWRKRRSRPRNASRPTQVTNKIKAACSRRDEFSISRLSRYLPRLSQCIRCTPSVKV